jgi:segregation and condensation protein B
MSNQNNLKAQIESLLFIAARPLSLKNLARLTGTASCEVENVLKELINDYNNREGGIKILHIGDTFQMSTAPSCSKIVQSFLKDEMTGELTRPALETLTIIAYRGPISKPELEQIRGVNCSLILRNLMIKGLIEEVKEKDEPFYQISFDFMRHLGITSVEELPDYEKLSKSDILEKILEKDTQENKTSEETIKI